MLYHDYIKVLHKDIDELLEELNQLEQTNTDLKNALFLEQDKNKFLQKENQQLRTSLSSVK